MGESSEGERLDWVGLPPAALVRAAAGLAVAALVAVLGALILGEYEFHGWLPVVAGVLFGLIVSEVAVELGRRRTWPIAIVTGVFAGTGLLWAGWISAGEGLAPIPGGAWLAAGIAVVVAIARVVVARPNP